MPVLRDLAIGQYCAEVQDPRVARPNDHALLDSIIIAIGAVICGAASWVEVEEFGTRKRAWRATIVDLPNGIPSHATFTRKRVPGVFARSDPPQFQHSLVPWVQALHQVRSDVIASDGKPHRRSHDRAAGKAALHLVSAWAAANRLVLGQVAVDDTSNAITAIPPFLDLLDLRGCPVTIDALGCQTAIAEQIVARGGPYVLALKGNQPTVLSEVQALFTDARAALQPAYGMATAMPMEQDHGRIETRRACVIRAVDALQYLHERQQWAQVRSVAMREAERTVQGTTTRKPRY